MATNYYTKKFNSTTELATFLNFSGADPVEYGTGYVSSQKLIAVTQTTYSDWQDINGIGGDLTGYVFISGAVAGDQYTALGTVNSASNVDVTGHADIGGDGTGSNPAPVNYRVYSVNDASFGGTIKYIFKLDHNSVILVWTAASSLHF